LVELAFHTQALRAVCEDADRASSEFGEDVATALRHRLADLRAAVSLNDVVVGSPNVSGEHVSVEVGKSHELYLVANHVRKPLASDGSLDWRRVRRLRVLEVRRRAQ
jgi:hypothetical protein